MTYLLLFFQQYLFQNRSLVAIFLYLVHILSFFERSQKTDQRRNNLFDIFLIGALTLFYSRISCQLIPNQYLNISFQLIQRFRSAISQLQFKIVVTSLTILYHLVDRIASISCTPDGTLFSSRLIHTPTLTGIWFSASLGNKLFIHFTSFIAFLN